MKKLSQQSHYKGKVEIPSSKSYMQRAIAIACLAEGESVLHYLGSNNDSDAALKMAKGLGAEVHIEKGRIRIHGGHKIKAQSLNAGESGLGLRMFTPIAALANHEIKLDGEGSLTGRPVDMLEKPLRKLGCSVRTNNGFVPIYVKGPMVGGRFEINGGISSQMISGLLISLSLIKKDTIMNVHNLKSIPYVDMTLKIMEEFGVLVEHENYEVFNIKGKQKYKPISYSVEGDWSGAAFHVVGAAIAGEILLKNLSMSTLQADRAIIEVVKMAGAQVKSDSSGIHVKKNELKAFDFDATHCPDLFPPLAVLAACCRGTSKIKGTNRLKHKESNRARVLLEELGTLGVSITIEDDVMIIDGGEIKGGKIHSHNDHRIAMAGAIAGLVSTIPVEIEQAEAVNKSYPGFWEDFNALCV